MPNSMIVIRVRAHRTSRRWTHLLLASLTLLGMSVIWTGSAEAVPNQRLNVLQFNVCNNGCYGGSYTAADDVIASINNHNAQIVTLNEVCASVSRDIALRTGMREYYIETNGPRSGAPSYDNNCDGHFFGNSALSDHPLTDYPPDYIPLFDGSSTEQRYILCQRTVFLHTIRACVTHITNNSTYIGSQITSVSNFLNGLDNRNDSWAALVGGDFNASPNSSYLNVMYNSTYANGTGRWYEIAGCNRCGTYTFTSTNPTRKLDGMTHSRRR